MRTVNLAVLLTSGACTGSGDVCEGDSVPPDFPAGEWSTEDLFYTPNRPDSAPAPVPATASITTTSVTITYTDDNGRTWEVVYTVGEEQK